jgi:hypothetical protein
MATATTKAAPRTTAMSHCSRGGNWEQWDGIHGASGQRQAGTNHEGKENKRAQEMLYDVSWAISKFFFLYHFITWLLTNFFRC